ncbi:Acyl-phosphate:glycerol-3-phosphate O-acyltransferase PlsY (EC 2.3.1.n3) [hydrothermal vent metagenome]|uniref:Acyl-phosphate:glycerol-3-phosphate O-acyltransferase PlsY n=1 Tax=hydrothermal vent metagenome TaxID=652676 RepID=A0A3B1B065_9ZZZZ
MNLTTIDIVYILAAYLIGSISSAIITCKLMSLPDPRSGGSKNPGATNVLRLGGKKAAAITLIGDSLKGYIPVQIAVLMALDNHVIALTAVAAFLGHLYPIFFGFKGGKGVATMLGVCFGFSPWVGLATALTWLVIAKLLRVSSLSALISMSLAPVYVWLLINNPAILIASSIMTLILFWRHRSNIRNLISGDEGRIG